MRRRALVVGLLGLSLAAVAAAQPVDLRLERLEGGKVRLSELRGQPVLLELWATWCVPCRQQAEILHRLSGALDEREVRVFAVDVGEKKALVREFLESTPSGFPVLLDPNQSAAQLFDLWELPALVALRADGTVAATTLGLTEEDEVMALLDAATTTP